MNETKVEIVTNELEEEEINIKKKQNLSKIK